MRKVVAVLLLLLAAGLGWLLFAPVPVEPVAWTAPVPPALEGPYARNDRLRGIERLAQGTGAGPEAVAVDASGSIYTGYADGRVVVLGADGGGARVLANTGGRPLGLTVVPGGLIVADAHKGLLKIDDAGASVLSAEAGGVRYGFADDVDRDAAGTAVYFSDASSRWGYGQELNDAIEHGDYGRLLRYDLASGQASVLASGLNFANGVAVGPDDAYVLVNETTGYRVQRYWLKGERAGTIEPFAENLPGFPDNITFNGRDRFWLALFSPRIPAMDALAPWPFLRKMVARLPKAAQPKPAHHAFVLALDLEGRVVANLQYDAPDAYAPITSVREVGPYLYFGSLTEPAIGRMPVAQALAP